MTGPDHYRAAEQLLSRAKLDDNQYDTREQDLADIAAAQVHATLALAAACALNEAVEGMPHRDLDAWMKVASVPATPKDGGR